MNEYVKELVTDTSKLQDWSIEINPTKEGKLCQDIVLALKNTMREHDLVYLTAPQIGYNRRLFCLRFGKNDYRTFINPVIENNIGITMSRETCVSIPGKTFIIPRFTKIKFFFTTPLGKVESGTLYGKAAEIFQHALEHLNGLLVDSFGLEIDSDFDNATEEEQAEILKMYAESLDIRQKNLEEEIKSDKNLHELDDAIKFMQSVRDGSTVLQLDTGDQKEDTK